MITTLLPLFKRQIAKRILSLTSLAVMAAATANAQNPAGVAGATAWLRADRGTTLSSNTITAWTNQANGANNLTPNGSPQISNNALNYNPVVLFTGSQWFISSGIVLPANSTYTKFVVFKADVAGTGTNNLVSGSPAASTAFWLDGTVTDLKLWNDGLNMLTASGSISSASYHQGTGVYAAGTGTSYINVDGNQKASGAVNKTYLDHQLMLGAHNTGTNNLTGKIAEAIVFPSALTQANVQKVESYLALKYGLPLGHNYVSSAGTTVYDTTGYNNGVAGIGRDDMGGTALTGFNQKQASAAPATSLVVSLGTLAAGNAANTGAFSANSQYLIWGNNNGTITSTSAVPGISNVNYVSALRFKMQNTSVAQAVQVLFPVALLPGFGTPSVVTSPDATFGNGNDAGTTMSPVTINGINYYACNITFDNGTSYFTFGGNSAGPGGIGGSSMWVKADSAISVTGTNVTAWTNVAAAGNNFTATNNPQYVATAMYNWHPSVRFTGSNYLTSASQMYAGSSNYTKFVVFRPMTATGANNLLSNGGTGTSALWGGSTTTDVNLFHAGNIATAPNSVNNTGAFFMATGVFNLGATNGTIINVDGTNKAAVTSSAAHTADVMQLGAYQGTSFLNGYISEAIVYPSALNATQISQIESYLGLKYGISLGHNYTSSDGTVIYDRSTYGTDIAGIGRDAASQFHQKQATTTYSNTTSQWWSNGTIVSMSLGTPAATNGANTNSFANDKSFVIWGNDNGSTANTAVTGLGTVNNRLTRIWKVTSNGTPGAVSVLIPVAGLSLLNANLLTNTTATFGSGATTTPMTIVTVGGNAFYSATITFPAGTSYFTFGGNLPNPGGVSGANVWVRADAGVTLSGSNVTGWANQTGTNNNMTAAGTPVLSATDINYNPAVTFNGNSALNSASNVLTTGSNYTKFVIFKYDASAVNNIIGSNLTPASANGGSTIWGQSTTTNLHLHHQDGTTITNIVSANNSVNTSKYYLASGVYNAGATNGTFLNVDGTLANAATVTATYTAHPLSIGGFNGSNYLNGRVAEAVIYPTPLSAANVRLVESYLGVKYGITLGHDYVASNGTTTFYNISGYGNNIAGIGRDDASNLNQRQASSIQAGAQVTMALGTLQASNAANANGLTTDLQFVTWGDNGLAMTYTSLSGVSGASMRSNRVWKVQNTNSVNQAVQVLIPASAISGIAAPVLVYDNSTNFGGSSATAAMASTTINGILYYAANVTWPAGNSYFALAGTGNFPGGVGGASLWVKANAGVTTSGSNVTGWTDQTTGADMTATGTPALGNNEINFNPAVTFNGSSFLTTGNTVLNANSNYSKFVVFRYDGVSQNNLVSAGGAGAQGTALWGSSTNTDLNLWHSGNNILAGANAVTSGRYNLGTGVYQAGATNGTFINVDGTQKAIATLNVAFNAHVMNIGAHAVANYLNGRVAEVIVYPSELTAAGILQVESYLGLKYGITLGHNYLAADGSTVVYNTSSYANNIAGIGRDDISSQNQKQSASINTAANAAMVTMGLNTIAASNTANGNTFANDKSYLIWGDNNTAVTETTTGLPAGLQFNKRLGRSWKIQRTGAGTNNVQVKVNLAGITATGTTAPDFALLIDRDGDGNFTTGTIASYMPTSYTGSVLTFDNVQWDGDANGTDVFTIATQVTAVNANIKVYLQGAMPASGTTMRNNIQTGTGSFTAPALPVTDPYGQGRSYSQINNVAGPAGTIADWIKVEVRSAATPGTVLQTRALLLKTDGSIVDVDGSIPRFNPQATAVRIVVSQRNHLNVMSNSLAAFTGGTVAYDFTTALTQAYKYNSNDVQPMKQVNGVWTLWAGDTDGSGHIDNADDKNVFNATGSSNAYLVNDVNMDGVVNAADVTITNSNYGSGAYSPTVSY